MELPYPPGNAKATKSKTRAKSVSLTWSAGFDGNSRITGYIAQKREVPVSGECGDAGYIAPRVLGDVL